MHGSLLRSAWSTTTPLSTASPAFSASPTLGCTPTPTTTASAGSSVPSRSSTEDTRPSPRNSSTAAPKRNLTPCSRCRSVNTPGDVGAEHPQQRQLGAFHDGDRGTALAGGRGDLQPDPAGADHPEGGAANQRCPAAAPWTAVAAHRDVLVPHRAAPNRRRSCPPVAFARPSPRPTQRRR